MNAIEQQIFDFIPFGTNKLNIKEISQSLNISYATVSKYLNRFVDKQLIEKKTIGIVGGTNGDATRQTVIIKHECPIGQGFESVDWSKI